MMDLPEGWSSCQLGQLVELKYGRALPDRDRDGRGYPVFGSNGMVGLHSEALTSGPTIVVGRKGSLGAVHLSNVPCFPIDTTYFIDEFHGCPPAFLQHLLTNMNLTMLNRSTAIPGLNRTDAYAVQILLPPLAEQKRIADKLDSLLAKVDRCRERLDRVPGILKRLRQAVLAAATSGRLTEEWRGEGDTLWRSVYLKDVASDFSYGSSAKSSPVGAVPVLRMGNIQDGVLDWDDLVFTSDADEILKYTLSAGDVLFNRTNSPELVGKTAVYWGERPAVFAGYLIRVRCGAELLPKFLNYCLNSPYGRDYCWKVKSDGVSQSNINAKKLAAFSFDLPSIVEQGEIVRRVEILFSFADQLELRYQAARKAVDNLTPSLLAKAFRGELVPQEPNDEPASVLLERIRTQRQEIVAGKERYGRRSGQKSAREHMGTNAMQGDVKSQLKEVIRAMNTATFSFDDLRGRLSGDYDSIQESLFELLSESPSTVRQVFDVQLRAMRFEQVSK